MQCIVNSHIRQTISLIKELQDENNDKKIEYDINLLLDDISKLALEQINAGFGFLLEVEESKYVITCSHIVGKATMRVNIKLKDIENNTQIVECKIITNIEEYEIAILKILNEENNSKFKFYKILEGQNLNFNTQHRILHEITNFINIDKIYVENKHVKYIGSPKIPTIVVESNELPTELFGLSGSLIVDANCVPIAMVSHSIKNSGKICCIPMSLIIKFVKKFNFNNHFKLSSIFIECDIIEIQQDLQLSTCHKINTSFGLTYFTNQKKKFKFKESDIIKKLDNIEFNSDGTIYNSSIGFNVDIQTYFLLESIVNVTFYRLSNDEYSEQSIIINSIEIESVCNIDMCNKNEYFVWKNHVFSELSDELINELIMNRLIHSNIYSYRTIKDSNCKIVIVFDGKTIKLVEKIGNKKINSLKDVKNSTGLYNKPTITCKDVCSDKTIKFSL